MVFRLDPALPVGAYKTYDLSAPLATHFRKATCQEVECRAYAHGWVTNVDTSTPLGAKQANYIRLHSGRQFKASQLGGLVAFTFPAEQQCFAQHRVPLERTPLLVVRGGDWRANLGLIRRHTRPADWVDDFAENQQSIVDARQRG
jgi:hypothetical protein